MQPQRQQCLSFTLSSIVIEQQPGRGAAVSWFLQEISLLQTSLSSSYNASKTMQAKFLYHRVSSSVVTHRPNDGAETYCTVKKVPRMRLIVALNWKSRDAIQALFDKHCGLCSVTRSMIDPQGEKNKATTVNQQPATTLARLSASSHSQDGCLSIVVSVTGLQALLHGSVCHGRSWRVLLVVAHCIFWDRCFTCKCNILCAQMLYSIY